MLRFACFLSLVLAACGSSTTPAQTSAPAPDPDWPMYGHDLLHTFSAVDAAVNAGNAATLKLAWTFKTGDAVSAPPTIAGGVAYFGAWDGYVYAVDAATGAQKWKFQTDCQTTVNPLPSYCKLPAGVTPADRQESDGGQITGSPAVVDGKVYIGGGRTLYALNAADGALAWKTIACGKPEDPTCTTDENDPTLIFSSPTVYDGKVFVGHTVNGADGYRGGILGLDAATGKILWSFETDPLLDAAGKIKADANGYAIGGVNRGCGSVWSSGAIDTGARTVYFTTGDCQSAAPPPYHESVLAIDIDTGHIRWAFRPRSGDTCDFDFGASVNLLDIGGKRLAGVGGKDGTYYALDTATTEPGGTLVWKQHVVFGGASGGFIGSAAFDGTHIFGGTAMGEFGEPAPCHPEDPTDTPFQDPSFHAFDAATGKILWELNESYTFGATSVAGGAVFNGVGNTLPPALRIYSAVDGKTLLEIDAAGAVNSSAVIVGRSVYFGTGNSFDGSGSGVSAYRLP